MTRDEAIVLAHIFRATRPDCSRKTMREFRQWSATRDSVAELVESHHGMNAGQWSALCEPSEREVWAKRRRKYPGD